MGRHQSAGIMRGGHAAAAPPSNDMNSRRPMSRVPDEVQREMTWKP
jgi:hypothetical protein